MTSKIINSDASVCKQILLLWLVVLELVLTFAVQRCQDPPNGQQINLKESWGD